MNNSTNSLLLPMKIMYYAMITMITVFGAVVFLLNTGESKMTDPGLALMLRYVLFGFLPAGVAAGYFIFKQMMNTIPPSFSLREKIMKYQTAVLIRAACLEMPGLVGAVAALITGDNSFLLFTAIVWVLFLLLRPTVYSITSDLNLSQTERAALENPASTPL